jgi:hypothetical protein
VPSLQRLLIRVSKQWGYEYGLVAGGAALGLLILVIAGFDERPGPPPLMPAATGPLAAPPSATPAESPPARAPEIGEPKSTGTDRRISPTPPVPDAAVAAPVKDAPAWRRFAAVHGPVLGRPMIAVIIDDMGLDRRRSARAVRLPGPLTMSFLTYARSLKAQAAAARAAGHEIMIHVPMEPDDSGDYAGPKSFRRDLPERELARRIGWALGRLDDYVGINNHMGSRFTAHDAGMARVLTEIGRRGLLFIDSRTSPNSVGAAVARRLAVPFAARDVFLDDDPAREAVAGKLAELERKASDQGYAIAIGHPYDSTLGLLETWLPTLASRGFAVVPVSAVVRRLREGELNNFD